MAVKVKASFDNTKYDSRLVTFRTAREVPGVYEDEEGDRLVVLDSSEPTAIGLYGDGTIAPAGDDEEWLWDSPLTRLPIQSVTFTFEEEQV